MLGALTTSLLYLSSTVVVASSTSGWMNDYGRALEEAKIARMPLLVIIERPNDPARRVEQINRAPDPITTDLLRPYKLCRVDVTTEYGQLVADAFKVDQFPYTVIINRSVDRIVFRRAGHFTSEDWVQTLISFRSGQQLIKPVSASSATARIIPAQASSASVRKTSQQETQISRATAPVVQQPQSYLPLNTIQPANCFT